MRAEEAAAMVGGSDVIRLLKKRAGRGKGGRKTQSMDIRKVLHGQQVKGAEKSVFISFVHILLQSFSLIQTGPHCQVFTLSFKDAYKTQLQ